MDVNAYSSHNNWGCLANHALMFNAVLIYNAHWATPQNVDTNISLINVLKLQK